MSNVYYVQNRVTKFLLCADLQACTEDTEAFGFEQSKKTYSLEAFGEKANQFKSFYFKRHPTVSFNPLVPLCVCGQERVNGGRAMISTPLCVNPFYFQSLW